MSDTSDFDISIRSITAHWRKIALFMVIGGLLGLIASMIIPPQYAAIGVFDIGIDFNRTHSLSRGAQDHAMERVRVLLLSDEVLEVTLQMIRQRNPTIEIAEIVDLRTVLKLGEIGSQWKLSAVDKIPETAVIIASSWVNASLEAIDSAMGHALRAADIQNDYYGWGCELIATPGTEMALWQCQKSENDPVQLEAALREEAALSHGLLPTMSFSLISDVGDSVSKLSNDRGTWILTGIFTGLVLSLWFILFKNS